MIKSNINQKQDFIKVLWDYLHLHQDLRLCDVMIVMGSSDLRVVDRAVELYKQNYAPIILISGKYSTLSKQKFQKTEAETFAREMLKLGIPQSKIILEKEATNTEENLKFSKSLLIEKKIKYNSIVIIGKDYVERRIYLTAKNIFPLAKIFVTSPNLSIENYCNDEFPLKLVQKRLIGEIDRLIKYPIELKSFEKVEIPITVKNAYDEIKKSFH